MFCGAVCCKSGWRRSARHRFAPRGQARRNTCSASLRSAIRRLYPLPCSAKLNVVLLCGAVQVGAAQIESALNSAAPICPVQHAQICTARRELVRRWKGRRCDSGARCAVPRRTAPSRAVPRQAAPLWRGAAPQRAEPGRAGADKRGVVQYGVYQLGFIVVAGQSAALRGTLP